MHPVVAALHDFSQRGAATATCATPMTASAASRWMLLVSRTGNALVERSVVILSRAKRCHTNKTTAAVSSSASRAPWVKERLPMLLAGAMATLDAVTDRPGVNPTACLRLVTALGARRDGTTVPFRKRSGLIDAPGRRAVATPGP